MPEIDRCTPLDQLPELLRAEEVAHFLGISKGLVYEMCRRGELRPSDSDGCCAFGGRGSLIDASSN